MTYVGIFDEIDLQDKVKQLKKELKQLRQEKDRGQLDLTKVIEMQDKEIDILKGQIDLKEFEIEFLKKKNG
jgi:lipid II:glycine glycyltransferase (peptidoglycan interpeptide bridge formation enzyme)